MRDLLGNKATPNEREILKRLQQCTQKVTCISVCPVELSTWHPLDREKFSMLGPSESDISDRHVVIESDKDIVRLYCNRNSLVYTVSQTNFKKSFKPC